MKFTAYFMATICLVGCKQDRSFTLASTTSTQNSGLYDFILPKFTAETGIKVKVVAVGTGQAIRIAKNGDADALLVHHRPSEDAFIADGYGKKRLDIMYNDFVLIGPKSASKDLGNPQNLKSILKAISLQSKYPFISRGDESGTHKKEKELWQTHVGNIPNGVTYREIGSGMGATLNMAAASNAITLSDRGTWLSFGNKQELGILLQGSPQLRNPYGLVLLNPDRYPDSRLTEATEFANWITSDNGQNAIGDFQVDKMQLFCPNAQINTLDNEDLCPSE